jgi:ABC-type multidrug transport system ATPase subunit
MRVTGISKSYRQGTATTFRVEDVSLSVDRGKITALVGPNGSGKTTVVKMLLGLARPESGEVEYGLRDGVGLLREGACNLFELLTVKENLAYFRAIAGTALSDGRMQFLVHAFRLEPMMSKVVARLSRGQRQHASLTVALMLSSAYCILDEPTIGLDIHSLNVLRSLLRQMADNGVGILVVSHDMDFVESVCDRSYIMGAGRIVDCVDLDRAGQATAPVFSVSRRLPPGSDSANEPVPSGQRLVTTQFTAASLAELLDGLRSIPLSEIVTIRNDDLSIASRYERQFITGAADDRD